MNANQGSWLEPCIRSLLEYPYTLGPSQIVVLDNASTDGAVAMIRSRFPEVRVMAQTSRRGFGANHQLVIEAVESDLVLLLNPDTLMLPGTLDAMVAAFETDERVVMAGGPIIDIDGTVWRASPFEFPTPLSSMAEALGVHRLSAERPSPSGISLSSGWLSGSALMLDRRVFRALGGFDTRYFLYFEETDLARRLIDAGALVAFHTDAPVVHEGHTSESVLESGLDATKRTRAITEYERSALIYMRKHFGRRGAVVYRVALLVGAAIRYLSTFVPPIASRMHAQGGSVESTRQHHRRRMEIAISPGSGVSFRDTADVWNARATD